MRRVLVSLDELLDTRLSLVMQRFPNKVEEWLHPDNHEYFLRMSDEVLYKLFDVDRDGWYKLWDKRDKALLRDAVVTYIPNIITGMMLEYQRSGEESLRDSYCEIHVNTYPYKLTEDEKRTYQTVLEESVFPVAKTIKLVSYDNDFLTYKVIKNNYDMVFMYDFNRWLDIHGKGLRDNKVIMGSTMFFAPRLFINIPDIEKNVNPAKRKEWMDVIKLDPFKILEAGLAFKLQLRFIPASDYAPILRAPYVGTKDDPDLVDQAAELEKQTDQESLLDPLYQFLQEQGLSPEQVKRQVEENQTNQPRDDGYADG